MRSNDNTVLAGRGKFLSSGFSNYLKLGASAHPAVLQGVEGPGFMGFRLR